MRALPQGHRVVWDGCRQGPGGASLFSPESVGEPGVSYVRTHRHGDITGTIRRLKPVFLSWFTLAQVMSATGLENDQVNSALANLQRTGELERDTSPVIRARSGQAQRYRWSK